MSYMSNLDNIALKGIKVLGVHGTTGSGRTIGQEFVVNACVYFDMQRCIENDSKKDSIDTAVLRKTIKHEFARVAYNSIEKAAAALIDRIFCDFCLVERVDICVECVQNTKENEYSIAINISRQKHQVYLALGSNLGDKRQNLLDAIEQLKQIGKVTKVSQFYNTKPEIVVEQPEFLNATLKLVTIQTPQKLLGQIKSIEKKLGRVSSIPNGPRKIDIDILMYDDLVHNSADLILPHPYMHIRKFVLQPLANIAPFAVHPVYKLSVADLWDMANS